MPPKKNHVDPAVSSGSSPQATEDFITVRQLAERLHVKPSTIYEWTRRRNTKPIPHFPISRKVVLFRWSEVCRWVEGQAA